MAWKIGLQPIADFVGICGPGAKKVNLGLRLAIAIDGKRPTKFGGNGVIVFELRRPEVGESPARPHVGLAQEELALILQELERAGKDKIDPVLLERMRGRIRIAEELLALKQPPQKAPAGASDPRIATIHLQKAQIELEQAQLEAERARATLAQAQANYGFATTKVQEAQARVKAAEKAFAEIKLPPAPPAPKQEAVFTIHLRMLTASEKVIRVKATGQETVVDALAYAGGDVLPKPNNYTVWVLRDGTVMPVDLASLSQKADTKTNYQLKAGDQFFVQAKPGK